MICNWTGPGNSKTGVSKVQRQQLSYDSTNNVWNLLQTILHLPQQMIVTLITHHTAVRRLEVQEQASPAIWKAFQTTSLNMVRSRPNHLQL